MSTQLSALIVFILLLGRALSAAAEEALAKVTADRARELSRTSRAASALLRLKLDPEGSAAALRAANVANLCLAAAVAAVAGAAGFEPFFERLGTRLPWTAEVAGGVCGGVLAATLATIFDLTSRGLANANPERWALRLSRPLRALVVVLGPALRAAATAIDFVLAPFGARARFAPPRPSLEALEELLELEAGKRLDPSSPQMIRSIFQFSEKTARDVMVPRAKVVAIDINTPPQDVVRVLAEEGHSRIPVYRDDIDHIVGILHTRDMVPLLSHQELIVLADVVRPAEFIPWASRTGDLLRQMQRQKMHMAMVVDEHGGFLGIVTLEDILSEIVGDIPDEKASDGTDGRDVEPQADGSFFVRASMSVPQFNRAFSVEIPEGPYETIAGYLNSLAGCIPEAGSKFFFSGLQFTVADRSPQHVRRVTVSRVKRTNTGDIPVVRT
jgi:putative hemolysin